MASSRAFTIVDVITSLAVITVLVALLLPSLSSVRETANQVICRSNVRQVGLGIGLFADDNKDRIPRSLMVSSGPTQYQPWATMNLRDPQGREWDGLGILYAEDYLPAPKLFYCPSHRGKNPYAEYRDAWLAEEAQVTGNYQYRGLGPNIATAPGPGGLRPPTSQLSLMAPSTALVSDGLRSFSDFNHQIGSNILRAGLSVGWYNDTGGRVANILAKDEQPTSASGMDAAWAALDRQTAP